MSNFYVDNVYKLRLRAVFIVVGPFRMQMIMKNEEKKEKEKNGKNIQIRFSLSNGLMGISLNLQLLAQALLLCK